MDINNIALEINELANANGFWDSFYLVEKLFNQGNINEDERILLLNAVISQKLMLMVSELGEACEAIRKGIVQGTSKEWIKDSVQDEITDTIIRGLDLLKQIKSNPEWQLGMKHAYNKTRPYKHGKAF